MAKKNFFDLIFLPPEAYNLFDRLDRVKGQSDISSYEKNVCKHYTDFITHALQTYHLPFRTAIFDKASLNIGLMQYDKLLEFILLVDKSLGKGLNFNKLQLSPPNYALGQAGFDEWINMATASVQSLPKAKMIYGPNACDAVGTVLFRKKERDFSLPKDMAAEMNKWCSIKTTIEDSVEEYCANRSIMDSIPEKWSTLFKALDSPSDPYTDDTVLDRAHDFAKKFIHSHPAAMIAVDDIVTLFLDEYRTCLSIFYAREAQRQKAKTVSFWVSFGAWAVVMAVLAGLLFGIKPLFIPFDGFFKYGFFANLGLAVACIVAVCIIAGACVALGAFETTSNFFAMAPALPRGACTMFCCYLVFASDYHEIFVGYEVPFYIFGVVCIIASLFYEFVDAIKAPSGNESRAIVRKWTGSWRGSVMFTTPLAILPAVLFFAFMWAMTFLHIVAIWIVMIFAIIATIVMIVGAMMNIYDM